MLLVLCCLVRLLPSAGSAGSAVNSVESCIEQTHCRNVFGLLSYLLPIFFQSLCGGGGVVLGDLLCLSACLVVHTGRAVSPSAAAQRSLTLLCVNSGGRSLRS